MIILNSILKDIQLLTDQPTINDELNYDQYASVIARLLTDSKTKTPLTIGIHGAWGCGKTSLMRMIDKKIKTKRIKKIWFDAWRFQSEEIVWTALLQTILDKIKSEKPKSRKALESISILTKKASQIALRAFILKTTGFRAIKTDDEDFFNYSKHVKSINDLQLNFNKVVEEYVGETGRIIIFIDDLDRCVPEKAVGIIEGMKLFLESEKCIFLIAIDIDLVAKGISTVYRNKGIDIDGESYLEKIIQIPFNIPPVRQDVIEKFLTDQPITKNLKINEKIIIKGFGRNPRKLKRFLNLLQIQLSIVERFGRRKTFDNNLLVKLLIIQLRWRNFFTKIAENPQLLIETQTNVRESTDRSALLANLKLDETEDLWEFLYGEPLFQKGEDLGYYIFISSLTSVEASPLLGDVYETFMTPPELLKLDPLSFRISEDPKQIIELIAADITLLKVDALINPIGPEFDMGIIGSKIWRMADKALRNEINTFRLGKPFKAGDILVTDGHNLDAKKIFHVVGASMSSSPKLVSLMTQQILLRTKEENLKTIAIPALGTGGLGLSAEESSLSIMTILKEFFKTSKHSIRICLVAYNKYAYDSFREQITKTFSNTLKV